MADYNIYIHSDTTTSGESHTKPKKKSDKENKTTLPKGEKAAKIIEGISNPDGLVNEGFNTVMKSIPFVAVAYAVLHLTDKTITTVQQFQVASNGDYSGQIAYSNFKQSIRNCLAPFSTAMNIALAYHQAGIEQKRVNQQISLLGDSVLNTSYTNKGV